MKSNLTIALAFAITIIACNNKEIKPESDKGKPKTGMMNPMETVEILKSNPLVTLQLAGELKPEQRTEVFAKVNSYVKSLRVDIGDKVVKGQVLAVLEAPEIQSQVSNAKSKLEAQNAIYLSTKSTFDRTMRANETKGAIAKDALEQIKARKLSDEAQLNAARSAYNELRNIDNYLIIRAPFSGTITSRNIDLGAYVGPMNSSPLLVIENNFKLRLHLSIPEANTPYINEGDTIRFRVRSQPQKEYFGLVKRKSGSLDLKLRAEKIEADISNINKELTPYMIAETKIPLQGSEPTFFVPKSAVVESGMGVYVIRIEKGKTKNVNINKGRVMEDKVEVFGDLSPGDIILKMGSEEVQEGTQVPSSNKKI
jgi:membrane fusion protein (multidrug efflux system)